LLIPGGEFYFHMVHMHIWRSFAAGRREFVGCYILEERVHIRAEFMGRDNKRAVRISAAEINTIVQIFGSPEY